MDLKGKSFLKLLDLTPAEIEGLLALVPELTERMVRSIKTVQFCTGPMHSHDSLKRSVFLRISLTRL